MASNKSGDEDIRCSFCGKKKRDTKKLVAGPPGVYICDECENINIGSYGTYGWFRRALESFSEDCDCFNELIDFYFDSAISSSR